MKLAPGIVKLGCGLMGGLMGLGAAAFIYAHKMNDADMKYQGEMNALKIEYAVNMSNPEFVAGKLNEAISADPVLYKDIAQQVQQDMYGRQLDALALMGINVGSGCVNPSKIEVTISESYRGGACVEVTDMQTSKKYPVRNIDGMPAIGEPNDVFEAATRSLFESPSNALEYGQMKAGQIWDRLVSDEPSR